MPKNIARKIVFTILGGIVLYVIAGTVYYTGKYSGQEAPQPIQATEQAQSQVAEEKPEEQATVSAEGIVQLVNEYRLENGLPSLKVIPELENSAMEKCQDIIGTPDENGALQTDFEHTNSETGVSGLDYAKLYYPNAEAWGENLAYGLWNESNEFVEAWLKSPSHKENIDLNFKYTGVAICTGGSPDAIKSIYTKKVAVQHFAQ